MSVADKINKALSKKPPAKSAGKTRPVAVAKSPAHQTDSKKTKAELMDELASLGRKAVRLERANKRLRENMKQLEGRDEWYRQVVSESPIGITVCDGEGNCIAANDSIASMIGATKEQVLAQNIHELKSWKTSGLYDMALRVLKNKVPELIETTLFTTSFGKQIYLRCYIIPFGPDGLMFMLDDRTSQRIAEVELEKKGRDLEAALREKEVLLSEVHHRVKNNLATVSSILQMQSLYIEDEGFKNIFAECQNRIVTMALVHEHLYNSESFAEIDLKSYVDSLVSMITSSYIHKDTGVRVEMDVDPLALGIETLLSIGMIINEAITNSLQHAFGSGANGAVGVRIKDDGDGRISLMVSDDGPGLPHGFEPENSGSLGFKLMKIFSRQLKGDFEVSGSGGTSIAVRFMPRMERQ